ncbi:MAG: hypothetical protein ACOYOV_12545 [Bacteroidales bacterium]
MEAILIQPKNKTEFLFVSEMLKKLNIKSKAIDIEEKEDLDLIELMKESDRSQKVTRDQILSQLGK